MKILGLILVLVAIIIFEVPRLWKDKMWRELIVFAGLFTISCSMAMATALDVKLPNPTTMVDMVFKPLSNLILNLLK